MTRPQMLSERLPHWLATGCLVVATMALLVWYYLHSAHATGPQGTTATARTKGAVESEMRLPRLGLPSQPAQGAETTVSGRAVPLPSQRTAEGDITSPQDGAPLRLVSRGVPGTATHDAVPVLVRGAGRDPTIMPIATTTAPVVKASVEATAGAPGMPVPVVHAAVVTSIEAAVLPERRWLLAKGTFVSCILETAIDSTLAGVATCVVGNDVFGADGRVVLLERGTRLIGETRSDVRSGQSRLAVHWTEARTPTGVTVNLASPATDALGRTGIPGDVDRHTSERFGAAVLLSMLDAGVMAVTTHGQGGGAVIYNAQTARDVSTEALRDSIGIPPTVRVSPGARLSVTVTRDLDFRAVYELAEPHAP